MKSKKMFVVMFLLISISQTLSISAHIRKVNADNTIIAIKPSATPIVTANPTKTPQATSKKITRIKKKATNEKTKHSNRTKRKNKIKVSKFKSLGVFKLTSYCACEKCCGKYANNRNGTIKGAMGVTLTNQYSIAVDPDIIPLGTKVYINGQEYIAQDTGGAIKGNRIDIYNTSHSAALNFGVQYAEVTIEKKPI